MNSITHRDLGSLYMIEMHCRSSRFSGQQTRTDQSIFVAKLIRKSPGACYRCRREARRDGVHDPLPLFVQSSCQLSDCQEFRSCTSHVPRFSRQVGWSWGSGSSYSKHARWPEEAQTSTCQQDLHRWLKWRSTLQSTFQSIEQG